jgi:circadian clock protein KaiB
MIKNAEISGNLISGIWVFKLYVCGENQRALTAYANLKKVCDERLSGQYQIVVVDLAKNPGLAFSDNITACPTVIKESPSPKRVVIGDLSKTEVVLARLDFPGLPLVPGFTKGAKSVSMPVGSGLKEFFGAKLETTFSFYPNYNR